MTQPFRSFVIFAEMRTGSNLLEATLNAIKRVTCFGEAFNPYMMGWPEKDELKGITMAKRKPVAVLKPADLGVAVGATEPTVAVTAPPTRKAGQKVKTVEELVEKLAKEAKVL